MSGNQSLAAMRSSLLNREVLRQLSQPRPWTACGHIALHWLVILAVWAIVAVYPSVYSVIIGIVIVGTQANALLIIAHDGLHRRLANSVNTNDLICDLLILGACGAVTRINRHNHLEHHRCLATEKDPDRLNYAHTMRPDRFHFLLFFTGIFSLWRTARNVFGHGVSEAAARENYNLRDLAIIGVWQTVLIAGLSWGIGWWAYPVLWLLPLYIFYFLADIVRVFAEHSELMPDDAADRRGRLVSFTSNRLERYFLAPHNMNFHAVHHLWPSIPYHNLPEADRIVRQKVQGGSTLTWRRSYLGHILRYWRTMPFQGTRRAEAARV